MGIFIYAVGLCIKNDPSGVAMFCDALTGSCGALLHRRTPHHVNTDERNGCGRTVVQHRANAPIDARHVARHRCEQVLRYSDLYVRRDCNEDSKEDCEKAHTQLYDPESSYGNGLKLLSRHGTPMLLIETISTFEQHSSTPCFDYLQDAILAVLMFTDNFSIIKLYNLF